MRYWNGHQWREHHESANPAVLEDLLRPMEFDVSDVSAQEDSVEVPWTHESHWLFQQTLAKEDDRGADGSTGD